jgi:chromosomal replication initiator protein
MYSLTAPILTNAGWVLTRVNPTAMAVRPRMTIRRIRETVASYFDVPIHSLISDRRARDVARPRQIAMYLSRELTPKSLPCIGREFNRDHTTVIHALRQIERLRLIDGEIQDDIDVLRRKLAG